MKLVYCQGRRGEPSFSGFLANIGTVLVKNFLVNLFIQQKLLLFFSHPVDPAKGRGRPGNTSGKLIEFDVLGEIRVWLARGLAIGKQFNAILIGESGTGKSTLLQQLKQLCQNQKPYVYCHKISCKQLIGKLGFYSKTLFCTVGCTDLILRHF